VGPDFPTGIKFKTFIVNLLNNQFECSSHKGQTFCNNLRGGSTYFLGKGNPFFYFAPACIRVDLKKLSNPLFTMELSVDQAKNTEDMPFNLWNEMNNNLYIKRVTRKLKCTRNFLSHLVCSK